MITCLDCAKLKQNCERGITPFQLKSIDIISG
mgnify:CR=1 FL=1